MFGNYINYCIFLFQVELEYADGSKFNLSAELLRIHSPAADGKIRSVGGEKVFTQIFFLIPPHCSLFSVHLFL